MATNKEQKERLKKVLYEISTDDERSEYRKIDKLGEIDTTVRSLREELRPSVSNEEVAGLIKDLFKEVDRKVSKLKNTDLSELISVIAQFNESLAKGSATKMGDLAPTLQQLIAGISAVDKSIKDKPTPVWNWPQYLSTGVRNKSFQQVNPAISPFGIVDYDEVALSGYDANGNPSTVTYILKGVTQNVLTLTYDGSGNLTDAKKTQ